MQANLPNQNDEPELHELVKAYKKHNHSETCRKYKNVNKQTIVAEPLDDNLDDETNSNLLNRHKEILSLVKQKIDDVLNPSNENYDTTLTETDV